MSERIFGVKTAPTQRKTVNFYFRLWYAYWMRATTLSTKERQAIEQSVLRELKHIDVKNANVLVAVSGGVDSMVLLAILKQWSRTLGVRLTAAYIHHGAADLKIAQSRYRNKALATVKTFCAKNDIEFVTNEEMPANQLNSEDELRQFRWEQLKKMAATLLARFIATAHHADDLIETQLLRLLRGTGPQGLKGFTARDATTSVKGAEAIIRPLLHLTKEQIANYAKAQELKFVEDPSNKEQDALRNWLRHTWLTELSKRDKQNKTNLKKSLAGSLSALTSQSNIQNWPKGLFVQTPQPALHTPTFLQLTKQQKEAALAKFMHHTHMKNYTRAHLAEILKRLDTSKKDLTFRLLGRTWHVTAQHISHGVLDIPTP